MSRSFPDETHMERGKTDSEPIRGGSIGLNAILGKFVKQAAVDVRPEFTLVLINAFTLFRNAITTSPEGNQDTWGVSISRDVGLFLEYYDTYLANTQSRGQDDKRCLVVVYFPNYKLLELKGLLKQDGKVLEVYHAYQKFLSTYQHGDQMVRRMDHLVCYAVMVGGSQSYPHVDLASKVKDLADHPSIRYTRGDVIALISHVPLDWYLARRLRGIQLLESFTAKMKKPESFKLKLDDKGRIPFEPVTHGLFGDKVMIESQIDRAQRRKLLSIADEQKWSDKSDETVRRLLSEHLSLKGSDLLKFDFI